MPQPCFIRLRWPTLWLAAVAGLLAGCGSAPQGQAPRDEEWAAPAPPPAAPQPAPVAGWQHQPLPGKRATVYTPVEVSGRAALQAQATASASLLRRPLALPPQELGRLRFAWKVPQLMAAADMGRREAEDAVVRVILSFDGDRSRLPAREQALSDLARLLTGEPLPYATLMYVWCPTRAVGSVVANPRTDRIRKLVVESGSARLNQWLDYERDIRADFRAVFGEEPGPLIGVALMTDSDNTQSEARAWYGPVELLPATTAATGGRM